MSDAVGMLPVDQLEALVADVQAEHRSKFKRRDFEDFRPSEYAGVRATRRRKYANCTYLRTRGYSLRLLSAEEVADFQAHVQRSIEAKP